MFYRQFQDQIFKKYFPWIKLLYFKKMYSKAEAISSSIEPQNSADISLHWYCDFISCLSGFCSIKQAHRLKKKKKIEVTHYIIAGNNKTFKRSFV